MSVLVVDASVMVKWFFPEIHSERAQELYASPHALMAPDLIYAETANVVWKRARRGEISADEGARMVADMEKLAIATIPSRGLAKEAWALAAAMDHPVYDALYVVLAIRLRAQLVTGDERLEAAGSRLPGLADHIRHIGTFAG